MRHWAQNNFSFKLHKTNMKGTTMAKVSEMIPSKYLEKEDVGAEVQVAITSVGKVNMAVDDETSFIGT